MEAMAELTNDVNDYGAKHGQAAKTIEEVAMGFIVVANEAMSRPIRSLTQMKVGWFGVNCLICDY